MTEQNGTNKQEGIKVISFGPGEAHLQNEILSYKCYICKKEDDEDMVLLRIQDKRMGFACLSHKGVVQEFIKQFKRPPLGWRQANIGETNA